MKSSSGILLTGKVKVGFHVPELEIRIPCAAHVQIFTILSPLVRRDFPSVRTLRIFIQIPRMKYSTIPPSLNLTLYLSLLYVLCVFTGSIAEIMRRSINPVC